MKAVILAGGLGTRLREETDIRPKPLVEIGGKPILWHILKIYSHFGIRDFIICLGYKGYLIKEYFANYALHMSDVTFDMRKSETIIHNNHSEDWRITLVDTGDATQTGGRLKRVRPFLKGEETFCLTYGDGVANIDIGKLLAFHRTHGKAASLTAVRPPGRFGALELGPNNEVKLFREKPVGDGAWINGGFFVLSPPVFDTIAGDATLWEREPLEMLARQGQLNAFRHDGFWHPMDTLRDKQTLDQLWSTGAPWNLWDADKTS
ncbi:MAG TPA: glucose-1-phosphate cytidylyltransferase [Rhizomicrobium sp.]|nr:glucose-1-phosphate cytidylyltransferase [Rhizomicrobium sp.]